MLSPSQEYALERGYVERRDGYLMAREEGLTRREGIDYLTRGGQDDHDACFSSHGATARECAPIAWRVAYLVAREQGEPITVDTLDAAMSMVVNNHDDVRYIVRQYGHGHYR